MMRRIASWLATLALFAAVALAFVWLVGGDSSLESAITALALLAALIGIPFERWAAARDRRETWMMMLRELDENLATLDEGMGTNTPSFRRRIFPRLRTSILATALAAGVFSLRDDRRLLEAIVRCQEDLTMLNRRLELTETSMFSGDGSSPYELRALDEAMNRPDGIIAEARKTIHTVLAIYETESRLFKRTSRNRRFAASKV